VRYRIATVAFVLSALVLACASHNGRNPMNESGKSGGTSGAVITVAAPGGYVTADAAFVVSVPYLVIQEDGRIIRLAQGPGGYWNVWKTGQLTTPSLPELLQRLEALGFWEWDSRAVEREVHATTLITDLPTTAITVRAGGREKTFACYGLRQYWQHHAIPALQQPVAALDLLEGLPAPDIYYPPAGEVLLIPLDEPLPRNASPGAWPLPALPLRVSGGVHRGSLLGAYDGAEFRQIVEVLTRHSLIRFDGKYYTAAYRPVFNTGK